MLKCDADDHFEDRERPGKHSGDLRQQCSTVGSILERRGGVEVAPRRAETKHGGEAMVKSPTAPLQLPTRAMNCTREERAGVSVCQFVCNFVHSLRSVALVKPPNTFDILSAESMRVRLGCLRSGVDL